MEALPSAGQAPVETPAERVAALSGAAQASAKHNRGTMHAAALLSCCSLAISAWMIASHLALQQAALLPLSVRDGDMHVCLAIKQGALCMNCPAEFWQRKP